MNIDPIPKTASELVIMLEKGQIDIFDAFAYSPKLAASKVGMKNLRKMYCERERSRKKELKRQKKEKYSGNETEE